jgi:hypothetical protein
MALATKGTATVMYRTIAADRVRISVARTFAARINTAAMLVTGMTGARMIAMITANSAIRGGGEISSSSDSDSTAITTVARR